MDYGLYEDLSLFNGDLLVGFPLLANEEPPTELPAQDGLVSILKTSLFEAPTAPAVFVSKPTAKVVLGHPQQGSADLGLADLLASSPSKDLPNPLESAWMDTKMDLLNLLTYDQDATPPSMSAAPAQATMSRPSLLQLAMPSSPLGGAAVVPSTSVPTTPEPSMEDNSLQGSLDMLQKLLSADVKMDTLNLNSASSMMQQSEVYLPEQDLHFSLPTDQVAEGEDIFMELCATGLEDLLSASLDASIEEGPILSPVSADDVESLLSSSPPSPGNGLTSFIDTLQDANQPPQADSAYSSLNVSAASMVSESDDVSDVVFMDSFTDPAPGPEPTAKISPRSAPYAKAGGRGGRKPDRKERKKEQNRTAALKYRQKKKEETGTVTGEVEQLEERNTELKDKVDSISREINYLKDLLAEVYKAKGLVPKKQIGKIIRKK